MRTSSDHNYIGALLRLKGKGEKGSDYMGRDRKNWDRDEYKKGPVRLIGKCSECQNVDLANSIYEDKLVKILNDMIPIKITQLRNKPSLWLEQKTLDLMTRRDLAREAARTTDDDSDWDTFKQLRNS